MKFRKKWNLKKKIWKEKEIWKKNENSTIVEKNEIWKKWIVEKKWNLEKNMQKLVLFTISSEHKYFFFERFVRNFYQIIILFNFGIYFPEFSHIFFEILNFKIILNFFPFFKNIIFEYTSLLSSLKSCGMSDRPKGHSLNFPGSWPLNSDWINWRVKFEGRKNEFGNWCQVLPTQTTASFSTHSKCLFTFWKKNYKILKKIWKQKYSEKKKHLKRKFWKKSKNKKKHLENKILKK